MAIVTGGAGGIGREYGRTLAEHGASVVLADLNAEGARSAADELQELAGWLIGSASMSP